MTVTDRPRERPAGPGYLAGRYLLLEQIGRGGMGEVFRASDRLLSMDVALKRVTARPTRLEFMMRPAGAEAGEGTTADDETRLALAREFRMLASLRHPNIISVLDSGFDEERQPFYTMSLLTDAVTVLDAARGRPRSEVLGLLAQLIQALAYLHRRGIVHRDLKPANVLVREGRLTVLDFGIALSAAEHGETAGTLAYMAPEVVYGQAATLAADVYAVGVIAYEMLTGRHPHEARTGSLLYRILHRTPRVADIDADPRISSLVARLLSKDAADRFTDAGALLRAFADVTGIEPGGESTTIRESYLQGAEFVGREAELGQLTAALEVAFDGAGSAWLLSGESGAGKSRLLEELRARALVGGAVVLRGRARAEGGGVYQLWDDALRQLCLLTDVLDDEAAALKVLVPDIEALLGRPVEEAPSIDPGATTARIADVVTALFRRLGRPVVLLLDDAQWASGSLEIVRRLGGVVHALPLLVVVAHRTDEGCALHTELPDLRTLSLGRLSSGAIARLAASVLGEPFGRKTALITLLERETEGNVFFVIEVLRALAEVAGGLDRITETSLPAKILSGGMREAVRRRLSRVAGADRTLLHVAAVAGRDLDLALLRDVAPGLGGDASDGRLDAWLARCADAMVIEAVEDRWRFAHDKIRDALFDGLAEEERRAHHRRLADAIERVHGTTPDSLPALAHHWSAAREIEPAVHYLGLAADLALQQGAPREAIALGMQASRLLGVDLPTRPEYVGLAIGAEMGQIHRHLAGRPASALLDLPPLTDARVARAIGLLVRMQPAAHISQQLELFALITLKAFTLTLAHGTGPDAPHVYASYAALSRGMTGDSRAAHEFSRLAIDLDARTIGHTSPSVAFLHGWFIGHWVSPLADVLPTVLAGALAGLDADRDLIYGCFNAAAYVIYLHASGAPLDVVIATAEAHARMVSGRVAVAAFHCRHELQVAKAFAGRTAHPTSLTDAAHEEERDVAAILGTANHTQSGYYHVSKVALHYHDGDYRGALAAADRATPLVAAFQGEVAEWQFAFYHALALAARAAQVEPLARTEMRETALAHAVALRGWAAVCESNFAHKALLVDGELARVDGRADEARALLERAAAAAATSGFRQDEALAWERRASLELSMGEQDAARRALTAAIDAYEAWGARGKVATLERRRREIAG